MTKIVALFYAMLAMLLIAVISYSMQKSEENFSPPKYTIGVVLKAMDSEHWLSVRSGMSEAAQQNNRRLIVITAENETAYPKQNKIIADLLANDIDALISQDGHESGKLAIEVVAAHLNNRPVQKYNFIRNELITAENAEQFLLQEDF